MSILNDQTENATFELSVYIGLYKDKTKSYLSSASGTLVTYCFLWHITHPHLPYKCL